MNILRINLLKIVLQLSLVLILKPSNIIIIENKVPNSKIEAAILSPSSEFEATTLIKIGRITLDIK